jgi:type IV pilus assembly protein PilX
MKNHPHTRPRIQLPARQRGVVLLFSLIALGIMLIASVALVRSFQSSLFNAGNIAFKRDLQNQSDRALQAAMAPFAASGGVLGTTTARSSNNGTYNYSAVMLPTDNKGIPNAFTLDDSSFNALGYAKQSNDITPPDLNDSVKIRYLVDRLCSTVGDEKTLGPSNCVIGNQQPSDGISSTDQFNAAFTINGKSGVSPQSVVYRLTIRVTGPRNTQSFFQSTFTVPS